jgi:GNAT superfamily N-acetyltransferase
MSEFNESILNVDSEILPFDCGDSELNGFLFDDAVNYLIERLAKTYIFDDGEKTVAYWALLNDSLSIKDLGDDITEKTYVKWYKRIANTLNDGKRKKSYPAVKIGRLAVHKDYKGKGIGRDILDLIVFYFTEKNISACKFITVDALIDAIPFYQIYGFEFLTSKDKKSKTTRLMYYELKRLYINKPRNPVRYIRPKDE